MTTELWAVYKQMDYLADELTKMDERMIDPVDYGQLKGAVVALAERVGGMEARQAVISGKIDQVLTQLAEAKGGWRALMFLGGLSAALGSAITWALQHVRIQQ